jgi:glycosyltransferase involved in cell wall biosynthesis
MMSVAAWLSLGAVVTLGLGLHPFITYPFSLMVLARLRPRPYRIGAIAPNRGVAICVCAYNEEGVIGDRIDNLLSLRASFPALEILIYVDGATDGTAAIVRGYGTAIRAHIASERRGKSWGMNHLVAMSGAELIVFSDANVTFAPDALSHLLAPFCDEAVGCVSGQLIYTLPADAGPTAITGSLYWRLEERIKELESQTASMMGADGSIFAIRRHLHRPPPSDLIDDMYVSLSILCGGHRIVRSEGAKAYEQIVSRSVEEFARKVRIACQAFNVHRALWRSLRHLPPLELYMYVSHKTIRWISIYLLLCSATLFMGALLDADESSAASGFGGTAVVAVGAAFFLPVGPLAKIGEVLTALAATGLGVFRSIAGARYETWDPPASARMTKASSPWRGSSQT